MRSDTHAPVLDSFKTTASKLSSHIPCRWTGLTNSAFARQRCWTHRQAVIGNFCGSSLICLSFPFSSQKARETKSVEREKRWMHVGWSAVCQSRLLCPAKDLGCRFTGKLEKPGAALNTTHVWNLCWILLQIMDNDSPAMVLKGLRKWGDILFTWPKMVQSQQTQHTPANASWSWYVLPLDYLKKGGQVRGHLHLSPAHAVVFWNISTAVVYITCFVSRYDCGFLQLRWICINTGKASWESTVCERDQTYCRF